MRGRKIKATPRPWLGLAIGLLGLSGLFASPARADLWECTRADGSVSFSSSRPRGCRSARRVSGGGGSRGGGGGGGGGSSRMQARIRARTAANREASAARLRAEAATRGGQERDRSPARYTRYDAYIREAAALYQLPEAFIRAVIRVESGYNPRVVSRVGAAGLMQLMPQTAARMGVTDVFDPRQNILGGTRLLRILANTYRGDLILVIAAYNAGEAAVNRHRGIPPYTETRRYVGRVLRNYYRFLELERHGASPQEIRRVSG